MIVLHAACVSDRLHVWGEGSGARVAEALAAAVPALGALAAAEKLTAWLPTTDGRPLPSSPLVAAVPERAAAPRLAAWGVDAVALSAEQSVLLLSAAMGRDTLAPGLVVSRDLAFWTDVLRFAAALAARERFLPGAIERGGAWHARWTPVYDEADARRRQTLAAAMPGACRALAATPE